MDPATVQLILHASRLVRDATRRDEMIERLDTVRSTLDQLILREIKSAYEAIGDALTTTNEQTRHIRLNYAEESLLKNTGLDLALETGRYKNIYLTALAHYGLAFVCMLRHDAQISAIHLLRSF